MAILLDDKTRIIILGITGREAATSTREMLDYGAKVVAGVTPGKGGMEVHGVPVYDSVALAIAENPADAAVISVPPLSAKDAVMECAAAGLKIAAVLTERVPKRDVLAMVAFAEARGMQIIGPNSPGIISPGKSKLGFLGGSTPDRAFHPGQIGIISRSGGMCTEIANLLSANGFGISTAIGMGGDPIVGSTYLEFLPLYEKDPETHAVVLFCEPGGSKEEAFAEWAPGNVTKPIIVFIGGKFVDDLPGTRFGHASVMVRPGGGEGSTKDKTRRFRAAGIRVVDNYADIPAALKESLAST